MKKAMLPHTVKRILMHVAASECEMEGLALPKEFDPEKIKVLGNPAKLDPYASKWSGDPGVERFFETMYKMASQGFNHGYTPGPDLKSNPSTPVISPKVYKALNFFIGNEKQRSVFSRVMGVGEEDSRVVEAQKRFKSAVGNLTTLFAETVGGKRKRDTAYPKTASESQIFDAEMERYRRLFVGVTVITVLTKVFEMDYADITKFIYKAVPSPTSATLKNAATRAEFMFRVNKAVEEMLSNVGNIAKRV
jgi:hypothetical protein